MTMAKIKMASFVLNLSKLADAVEKIIITEKKI